MFKKSFWLIFLLLFSCKVGDIFHSEHKAKSKAKPQDTIVYDKNSNDIWTGEAYSGFFLHQKASAQKFMISSSDERASKAGLEILKKGGSAIDAALAAEFVLNVVEPQSSGIGGGAFFLYHDAKSKNNIYFNGRERAPIAANERIFLDKEGNPRKFYDVVGGGLSVGTPGALKAWKKAHEKYGKLPWNELFEPAIKIAKEGFVIDRRIQVILETLPYLNHFNSVKIYFDKDGLPKKPGSIVQNPQLAQTFETIANQGIKPFYEGKIARDIVATVKNSKVNPGYLSLADLQKYQIKIGLPICGFYRQKYKICSMPMPSSGGVTLLETLGILENFDLSKIKPSSLEAVHLLSEASRLAYADRNEYVGDLFDVPVLEMLDKKYLMQRASMIDMNRALTNIKPGNFAKNYYKKKLQYNAKKHSANSSTSFEKPSTTHISVIDRWGNAVSMTSSIEYFFGSVLMVDGFMLNNQLTDFSFVPEMNGEKVANALEPMKQPRSSMSPVFVFDEKGNLIMAIGSPGGPRIIQYVLKAIVAYLDWGLDIQQAISLPNHVALNGRIELEKRTSLQDLQKPLEAMGHKVAVVDITSGLNGIVVKNNVGSGSVIEGGADPRRNGFALGE